MANLQKGVLQKIDTFLKSKKYDYEVIIVDDGSTDGSIDYVAKFTRENKSFHLITNKHLGKAGAVTTGILKAAGEYVLFTDMDQATPIEEVDNLVEFFKEGFDIVIGSRSIKRKGSPFTRVIMSRAVIILRKLLIGMHDISDTQCGFKAFKHDVAKKLFTRVSYTHIPREQNTQADSVVNRTLDAKKDFSQFI